MWEELRVYDEPEQGKGTKGSGLKKGDEVSDNGQSSIVQRHPLDNLPPLLLP